MRVPFQGVINIIRFNWHFYAIALGIILFSYFLLPSMSYLIRLCFAIGIIIISTTLIISTFVSYYIYDQSDLYEFDWLTGMEKDEVVINVHAGFDETSLFIHDKIGDASLIPIDFYDPKKHTEISIKRARDKYPNYPGTIEMKTNKLLLDNDSVDLALLVLSAHEIRNDNERSQFFNELKRVLKPNGEIIVIEHTRDLINFIAYNIGFLHFLSRKTWMNTFSSANLRLIEESKITAFLTKFKLKYGDAP